MSNKRWLDNLVWTGAKTYLSEEMKPWSAKVDGSDVKAGDTKTAYSLGGGKISKSAHAPNGVRVTDVCPLAAFATIEKAGHMGKRRICTAFGEMANPDLLQSRTISQKSLSQWLTSGSREKSFRPSYIPLAK